MCVYSRIYAFMHVYKQNGDFRFLPDLYIATWGKKYLPKTLILFSQNCHLGLKRVKTSLNWVRAPNSAVLASESQFY